MKICACVAEYNPFHLGHIKHVNYVKNTLGADKLIVVMSGNFTQRGEIAILDKFTRAKHAVIAGADMVIELPTVFATGNAETFSLGAMNIINSLNVVNGLCFGVESATKESLIALAKAMNDESKEFKKILKSHLDTGVSLAKAKFLTVKDLGGDFDENDVALPNNVLGLEYTKALLKLQSNIEIYPMLREGNHNDKRLKKTVTSASSIRETLKTGNFKTLRKNLPSYVYKDLKPYPYGIEKIILTKLLTESEDFLKQLPDCTEGLENRIKALSKDNLTVNELVQKATTKRYTSSRIRRILISNLLSITEKFKNQCLGTPLYAKVLAINSESKDLLSLVSEKSSIPVLTRKSDARLLKKTALQCFEKDSLASDIFNLATDTKTNENYMLII